MSAKDASRSLNPEGWVRRNSLVFRVGITGSDSEDLEARNEPEIFNLFTVAACLMVSP